MRRSIASRTMGLKELEGMGWCTVGGVRRAAVSSMMRIVCGRRGGNGKLATIHLSHQ